MSITTALADTAAIAVIVTGAVAVQTLVAQRRDSRDRTRPLIVASLQPGPLKPHGTVYLVIRNAGATVARNLQVTFKPEIPTRRMDDAGQPITGPQYIRDRYSRTIAMLGPGESLRNLYINFGTGNVHLPWQIEVAVVYQDDRGRPYRDRFPLFVDAQLGEFFNSLGGTDWAKNISYAVESAAWELWKR
jgi:hypothetical protein